MPATSTPRTPEGRLIRHARKQSRLSIPAAAAAAGISAEHWGNVERGYRSLSADEREDVTGTADMIALMARTVRATPHQLVAAGRRDAADALLETTGMAPAAAPPSAEEPAPSGEEEDRAATIAAVQQLYSGDSAAMNAAMYVMTQWHKPLAQRRQELRLMERDMAGAAEALAHVHSNEEGTITPFW
jgi:transcriptional regulator with XRE-family HTH domain